MSLIKSTKLDEANKYELEVKVEKEAFAAATIKAYKKQASARATRPAPSSRECTARAYSTMTLSRRHIPPL